MRMRVVMIARHSKQMAVWDFGRMRCDPHHGSTVGVSSGGGPGAVHAIADAHAAAPSHSALCTPVEQRSPEGSSRRGHVTTRRMRGCLTHGKPAFI